MNSSGKKRGLAFAATTALAIAGLPLLAGTATAQTVAQSSTAAIDIQLYSQAVGSDSTRNDGTNTTVSLVAGVAGRYADSVINPVAPNWVDVNSVRFSYRNAGSADPWQQIADVVPTAGVAAVEWSAPTGNFDIQVEALDNFGVRIDPNGGAGDGVDAANGVDISNTNVSVRLEPALHEAVGQFKNQIVVGGTTSGDDVDIHVMGPESLEALAPSIDYGATVGGLTSFRAPMDLGANNTADANDDVVVRVQANELDAPTSSTNDVQVVRVYDQVVSNVTVEVAPGFAANVPLGNGFPDDTEYIIKVTDQFGEPIYNVDIVEAGNGGAPRPAAAGSPNVGATDLDGEFRVTVNEATMDNGWDLDPAPNTQLTKYRVDVNSNGTFENGTDWLVDVRQSNYPQVPTTVTIENKLTNVASDGTAMDDDENSNLTFTVRDSQGNPVPNEDVFVKVNYGHGAAAYSNAGTTNGQGKLTIPFSAHNGENETVSIDAYANVDGNPAPTVGDAIASTFKIETGESEVIWDNGTRHQVLANGTTVEEGTLQLKSGTALPGRTVAMDAVSGNVGQPAAQRNVGIAPTADQPAVPGVLTGDSSAAAPDHLTQAAAKAGAAGNLSIRLVDPAAPVGQELDSVLRPADVNGPNGLYVEPAGRTELRVDWLRSLAPATVTIFNQAGSEADFSTNDNLSPWLAGPELEPGRLGRGYVEARNADGILLTDQQIPVRIGEGHFVNLTSGDAPVPSPAPTHNSLVGTWSDAGKSINVTLGDDYEGNFAVNIGRHAGFDDNGRVNDKVNAGTGNASFEYDFEWNTIGVPLNNGSFDVSLAENQESPILPKARAGAYGHDVTYDVVATDQFGNRTAQPFTVLDDTAVAHSTTSGNTQFTLDGPAVTAWADSATDQTLEVELVNERATQWKDFPYDASVAVTPGNVSDTNADVQQFTAPINWYNLDLANSTFTLGQAGAENVPVGSTVNEVANSTDQEGAPIAGIDVVFTRSGPADLDSDGNVFNTTGANGNAIYTFAGGKAGVATITASFFDGNNLISQAEDKVTFDGAIGGVTNINAKVTGKNNGAKADKLKVVAGSADAAGATVKLYKRTGAGDVLVGTKTLNKSGNVNFKVKDRNGKKKTKYYAVVSATDLSSADRTSVKKVK